MADANGCGRIIIVIPSLPALADEAEEPAFSPRYFDLEYEGAQCPSTKN